ncbi:DUF6118 family protein [Sphingobium sp. BYY-5]|uniref:DUF6118 family protein n=1 Tax=Sphingobium sp. BYY-5 TaxID=2926400 RepID=UPI001FA7AD20|nr:DUF6118 family protein [Sphingobium sp. BYY-5]MCI4590408.1 DUF6118 family protein [Sphingobium sp. BYY-5]
MDSSLPTLAPEPDPAAIAFTRLAEKIDLLEAAIAGLAAKREATPDYSETLGEIAALLEKMRNAINTLARRPAMQVTSDAMADQIAAAGTSARAEDAATIKQAKERIDGAASRMEHLAGTVATICAQRRRILWAIGGGMVAGMMAWSILPGVVLRALPQGWHMPEKMAAHIIGEPTLWDAGTRLMQAGNPEGWQAIVDAANMRQTNRDTIDACERAAVKAKAPVRCVISIGPSLS